ncbi:sulfatase [Pirellulimonas nuda]|nr:sulfatase [Pirellulimonas nuda]
MIAIDDLNDYVSVLQDHPGVSTPNFDRLAKRSVNFTRGYCAAPLCNPSRVAVVTGMAPHQTGVYQLGDRMSRSAPAMAAVALEEQFKRHGYDTYLTGKYYHANQDRWLPANRLDAAWTQRKPPFSDHGPMAGSNKVMGGGVLAIGPAPGGMKSMPDVAILKNTRAWLADRHAKPFFLAHGISKPHVAFVAPQEFFDLHPLGSVVLPETIEDDDADISPSVVTLLLGTKDAEQFAKVRRAKNGWREVMQAYLASISFCDWVVGQILDELDASPYADNTVIVLWSDHGYHIGEKERLHKRALWTQTCRVPFLVSVPGMEAAGRSCAEPVSLLDIYPTLNELCALDQPAPQALAGRSLAPLLENPDSDWPRVVVTSHDVGNAAATDVRYHYIRYADGSEELYDHQTDPREYHNLALRVEFEPIKGRLAAFLPRDWVRSSRPKAPRQRDGPVGASNPIKPKPVVPNQHSN